MTQKQIMSLDETINIVEFMKERQRNCSIELLSVSHHLRMYKGMLRYADSPTIEAEPVRHGIWVEDKDGFHHCSECGENTDRKEDLFGYDIGEFKNPYCGNCGAKMNEEA